MSDCGRDEVAQQITAAVEDQSDSASLHSRAYVVYMAWAREKEELMREQAAKVLQTGIPKLFEHRRAVRSARASVKVARYLREQGRRMEEMMAELARDRRNRARQRAEQQREREEEAARARRRKAARIDRILNYTVEDPLGVWGRLEIELLWKSAQQYYHNEAVNASSRDSSLLNDDSEWDREDEEDVPVRNLFAGNF